MTERPTDENPAEPSGRTGGDAPAPTSPPAPPTESEPPSDTTTTTTDDEDCFARILGDTDRDGVVKYPEDEARKKRWTWGRPPRGRGAIVLYNCDNDNDDDPPHVDAANDYIDGALDVPDITEVVVSSWPQMPQGWKATVSVTDPQIARLYYGRLANEPELPNPCDLDEHDFRSGRDLVLGLEARAFPHGSPGTYFDVVLQIIDDEGEVACEDRVRFRIAPWLMVWNGRPLTKAWITLIRRGADTTRYAGGTIDHHTEDVIADVAAVLGTALVVVDRDYGKLRWVQDWMEVGEQHSPYQRFPVVMESPGAPVDRNPPNRTLPLSLLKPDFGYAKEHRGNVLGPPGPTPPTILSSDLFGNLEVSPPVTVTHGPEAKDYLFGRIYHGVGPTGPMAPEFVRFLEDQVVQHPFQVDTSWLAVGHVDEVVTFVPATGRKGFRMLVASPRLALDMLGRLKRAGNGAWKLLTGRRLPPNYDQLAEKTIDQLFADRRLVRFNERSQRNVDRVVEAMREHLDLAFEDVVPLPVLFREEPTAWGPIPGSPRATALTANVVNLLMAVTGRWNAIVPRPYGPVRPPTPPTTAAVDQFEDYCRVVLQGLGIAPKFTDTWYAYHVLRGEIHCGTQAQREERRDTFWWWQDEPEGK